jgi:uncharacterized protein YkwD
MVMPRASVFRRALIACAASAGAAGVAALMVTAAPAASGDAPRQEPAVIVREAPVAPAALWGLPAGAALVDRDGIARAAEFAMIARYAEALEYDAVRRFGHALATLPPAPAPVVAAEPPAPPPNRAPSAPPHAQPTSVPPTATPAPPPPAPAVAAGLDTSPMDAFEQALFDATNARRVANGLAPLRANGSLVGIARLRSQDMATNDYFAHTSPVTGKNAFDLMGAYGIGYGWAGENLAMNNYPADECVPVADQALWDSPPHRENMLHPRYTEMGIGHVERADGMHYFTIIFTGPA